MAWSSSGKSVIAALQKQEEAMDFAVETVANQGLITTLNEVHARMIGHIDTGNMDASFDQESKVERVEDCHYRIILANAARSEKNFPYHVVVEARFGMMSSGVHAAIPQIAANLKQKIEESK
jgi:hypothetical protein